MPVDPNIAALLTTIAQAGVPPMYEGTPEAGRAQYLELTHGARKPEQLAGLDEAFGWKLSASDLREIDALLARHITDPVGPEFMAPPTRQP